MIQDVYLLIPDPLSGFFNIPNPGVKKVPGSGSVTLLYIYSNFKSKKLVSLDLIPV
jgi:hypothetical protein